MQNLASVFEEYYSKTPFKKVLWNQLDETEVFDVLDKLKVPKNFRIVSLGCGTGQKEIAVSEQGYRDIIGVDISKSAIKTAESLAKKEGAGIKFYVQDVVSLSKSSILENLKNPDLLLDWMSFHTIEKKDREKYISSINAINPRWFLIRTFSKKDSDYEKAKKDKLPNLGAGKIYRHFFSFEDLVRLFNNYCPVLQFDTNEHFDPKKFIDNKIAAKITVLFLNKKRIFS